MLVIVNAGKRRRIPQVVAEISLDIIRGLIALLFEFLSGGF
ncbi:hypothetical protein [Fodinicola acaciae]|nr:hypothetical protein [Fodinicola acaciae]